MKYTIQIDWLSIYCIARSYDGGEYFAETELQPCDAYQYKRQPYGTRQFKYLDFVYMGKEKVAEVQHKPLSDILERGACIVKFDNRVLYAYNFADIVTDFVRNHNLLVKSVSRIDIATDFVRFQSYEVVPFIRDFMSMKLRHIGRGDGAAYFEHRAKVDKVTKCSEYNMKYSGLSFGSHSSDVRVYLYNKTKELAEQTDKPYIRDRWTAVGFGDYSTQWLTEVMKNELPSVWRLEVSIKGKGIHFKDNETKHEHTIAIPEIFDTAELRKVYFTFIHDYFQFVVNRPCIRNITREPRIDLFGTDTPIYDRRALRCVSGGNMSERVAIHKLWQLSEEYRKLDNEVDRARTQEMAIDLADASDLTRWLTQKMPTWAPKTYKK